MQNIIFNQKENQIYFLNFINNQFIILFTIHNLNLIYFSFKLIHYNKLRTLDITINIKITYILVESKLIIL